MAETWTIGTLLQWTRQYFRDKGVENPRLDADVLLSSMLGKDRLYLYVHFDQPMEKEELAAFREIVRRRAARVPVAYITGRREFMGMDFQVTPAVLIPRPDTEILVEAAMERLRGVQESLILDVGTGSGAVLIGTLSRTPGCRGVGVDISRQALEVAEVNAERLLESGRASFLQADLFPPEPVLFDAVLSNPPYITTGEMPALSPEVRQEPELALHGGKDGLDFYRRLIDGGARYLKPEGFMAFEVGAGQAREVSAIAEQAGWKTEKIIPDYAGIERVVVLRRAGQAAPGMKTQYCKIDRDRPDPKIMEAAADILLRGGLVAFPTETVYGLGANGLDTAAVGRIFEAKGRPADNPLILHIAERCELDELVAAVPDWLEPLLAKYWPGPFTVVLPRSKAVPDIVTAGLDTVAVRMPSLGAARELIRAAGVPVAAPSANLSGRPSPTTAEAVMADLEGRVEMVLDAGPCEVGLESTVLDCVSQPPTILRPGGVTQEMLESSLEQVRIAGRKISDTESAPRAPGMKYRHYAPAAPMILFAAGSAGTSESVADQLMEAIDAALRDGKTVGAVVSSELAGRLPGAVTLAVYGSREHPGETAAGLYEALRYFDTHPVDVIFAEGVREEGIGRALMNRLYKAASSVREG